MLSISFFLRTPDAVSQSQVYVSISNKEKRLQFATGESFVSSYCNARKKKGTKPFIKKNSAFYFEYTSKLTQIRDSLIRIEMGLSEECNCTLEQIRDAYYLQTGKLKAAPKITFEEVYGKFIDATESRWSYGTRKHFTTLENHLAEFEKTFGKIKMDNLNEVFWNEFRDTYFVRKMKFGNGTINKNLKKLKQFLVFAEKKQFVKNKIDFGDLKFLDEIETFKIALKEHEVETIFNLDLTNEPRLDKVRDLFALEILTGQRFSDISKVLDPKHISETNIQIYQQKSDEKVSIPLHPKLKKHLSYILEKYPEGFPAITNQNFNDYIKEVGKLAKMNREHSWVTLTGKTKVSHSDFRYNLISSHTGRRTFCTLALKSGINSEMIMKVSGHRSYDQFREYIKVDDDDLDAAFQGMMLNSRKKK